MRLLARVQPPHNAERAGALIGQPTEEGTVSGLIMLKKLSLVGAGLVVLMPVSYTHLTLPTKRIV